MCFSLWRQDDNGNLFLVGEFSERAAAEARLAELTRSLHRQTYWIDETELESNNLQQVQTRQPSPPDKDPT